MSDRKYLLTKDKEDSRDRLFVKGFNTVKLPESVDLRPKMPPIINQGQVGSCQTCALLALDQYAIRYSFAPSVPFGYYNLHDVMNVDHSEDCGGTLRDTIKTLVKYGACNSDIWANTSDWTLKPTDAAYADGLAGDDELHQYYRIKSEVEIQQALAQGYGVYIGVQVYESFESEDCIKTGNIPMPQEGEKVLGGHALDIVGYITVNNVLQYIIRNSWGTEVGDKGYFYISSDALAKILMDAWIIVK